MGKKQVTIQQHPIYARSDSPAYKCIEVYAYLLAGLLEHTWSTAKQLHSRVFASFSVEKLNSYKNRSQSINRGGLR
jgi:hypothetical protein